MFADNQRVYTVRPRRFVSGHPDTWSDQNDRTQPRDPTQRRLLWYGCLCACMHACKRAWP